MSEFLLKTENWILDDEVKKIVSKTESGMAFNNTTSNKIEIPYKNSLVMDNAAEKFVRVSCDYEFTNAGGYISMNDLIYVPLNSTVVLPILPPVELNVKLVLQAESSISLSDIKVETFAEKTSLIDEVSHQPDVLVIVPDYPSLNNLYNCAFAHSRNKEYVNNGIKVQVAAISQSNWYQTVYEHDGVSVFKGSHKDLKDLLSRKQYKVIITHFVDENLYSIFDGYISNEKLIFICHGPETVFRYLVNVTRPYFTPAFKEPIQNDLFDLKEKYVKKYSQMDNVEWVFVSDWLKEFSEEQLNIKFKHSRVINNIINEELFPYSPKTADDRRKILIIRKFDNICQHSLDQVVLAILHLSRKDFFKDLEFEVYGDGNFYETLIEPILQFDNVHLHRTFIPNNKISSVHAKSGILLIPSRHDAHAVAMGEGASSGLVVVGSRVTSNPFFMNESENHTLADAEDYKELAGIIERLYNNPDEFLEISQRLSNDTRNNYCKSNTVAKEIKLIKTKLEEFSTMKPLNKKPSENPTLTIAIPSYNVEKYIGKCINSILIAENIEDIEILVINDGSTDKTAEICAEYERISNGIVKLINKENGGHGSTINTAIKLAKGKYFRLVDGDDWVDAENLSKLVEIMKNSSTDIILTKGSYEYIETALLEDIIKYDNLVEGNVYHFDDLTFKGYGFATYGPLLTTGNYRTELLQKAGFTISEKKPYVDMEFNAFSLQLIDTIEYHNLDIYRYLIGREGQTISRDFWKRKYKDHLYIIFNILDKIVPSDEFSAGKKSYIYKNIIAQMVDSQIFMFDCLCLWEEIDVFLNKLKEYGDIYDFCIDYIVEKDGNCNLILKTYKEAINKGNKEESIIIPGVREYVRDLEYYPLTKSRNSKGFIKKAIKAVLPYGIIKLARKIKSK